VSGASETLGDVTRDSWITTKLKSKLVFDGNVASRNYTIVTVGAVVYVMGVAQNQGELNAVIDHARHVAGVRKVVSYVRLKDEPQV
jgi:osmotically-inducible protein OsmY